MAIAENLGTIWVCQNCIMHEANGECGDCHGDGHDKDPLSNIQPPYRATLGLMDDEHADHCARHPLKCTECGEPATHAVWWQNEDGTREGEPRCGEFECMDAPAGAVAGGTVPIPTPFSIPNDYECDCAENTFSTSQCEGCGSYLYGERYAMTLWKV